tara:strand:- start:2039 stop:2620 length:582 start_codon:yes stop_codon:yes gene_type:complete
MNDSDKKAFAELMVGNGEMYNKQVSKSLMQIYFDTLITYCIEDIRVGFSKHSLDSKNGSFFPKPADIVRHLQASEISQEDKAMLAWSQVVREIRRTGSYGTLNLDDKQALAAVKALGSWQQLCNSTETEMTWKKKEFMNIYETYEKTPLDMLPNSMPGRFDLIDHKNEQSESFKRISDGINDYRAKLKNKGEE